MKTFNTKEKVEIPANVTTFNSEGKRVDCHFLVRETGDATEKALVNVTFDFTNVSNPELVKLAVSAVVIKWQAVIRAGWADFIATPKKYERVVDVKTDILDVARSGKTDVEKADAIMAKLTPEQIAAIIAKHSPKA